MSTAGTDRDFRGLKSRWTITCLLTMKTAFQLGSREGDDVDSTFERDADGRLVLRGSTLAGALRSAIWDSYLGYGPAPTAQKEGPIQVKRLFGDLEVRQSPLVVFDSPVEAYGIAHRDGVRIEAKTGIAADGAKYDRDLALPGVVFPIRVDLEVDEDADEGELLSTLAAALDRLAEGAIRLGARKTRGLGECVATKFRAKRYDLSKIDDWLAYADSSYALEALHGEHSDSASGAAGAILALPAPVKDARDFATIDLALRVEGTLLIRQPNPDPNGPDVVAISELGKKLLTGSSLAGAMRSRASQIISTCGWAYNLERLFGPAAETPRDGSELWSSRVVFDEGEIVGAGEYDQVRIKIDRFTQGVVSGALLEERPAVGGTVSRKLVIINPTDQDLALMALVCRDLCEGLLSVGGGAAIGRGVLRGSAAFARVGSPIFTIDEDGRISGETPLPEPSTLFDQDPTTEESA